MKKIRILICDITHAHGKIFGANTTPLGIGMIGSYLKHRFGSKVKLRLCKFPDRAVELIKQERYHIVGFSNYSWNLNLSYRIATLLKSLYPDTIVCFGGPNYPEETEGQIQFLKEQKAIDFYIYKEGEAAFGELIQALIDNDWDIKKTKGKEHPGCHFLYEGNFIMGKTLPRILDLDSVPSPYITGLLDEFFDKGLITLVQTDRGCPFSCTYCSEGGKYHSRVVMNSVERIYKDLVYIAKRYKGPNSLFIADSNFGMYKRDIDICRKIAEVQSKYNWPKYINVATGKNLKGRVIKCADIIGGALRLGASVQSTDPEVLKNIKRENISTEKILDVGRTAALTNANT